MQTTPISSRSWRRFKLFSFFAMVGGAAALAACGDASLVKRRQDELRTELAKAQSMGAKDCAPEELAKAEANLDFGELEMKGGDYMRAEDHFEDGFRAAKAAQRGVRNCKRTIIAAASPTPKPIIVVFTPTPSPSPSPTTMIVMASPSPTPTAEPMHTSVVVVIAPTGTPTPEPTPQIIIVKETPTPTAVPSATVDVNKIDSDGDGVPDVKDECPADPGPPWNNGCPAKDSDGDGIPDAKDLCPTVAGLPQFNGCPPPATPTPTPAPTATPAPTPDLKYIVIDRTKKRIELKQQIHFETGKAVILQDSFGIMDEIAKVLKENTTMEVRIEGHTDSTGTPIGNLTLSKNRADACRSYLMRAGVDGGRLRAVGLGQTTPIADNRSQEGRAMNRRVEFHITQD